MALLFDGITMTSRIIMMKNGKARLKAASRGFCNREIIFMPCNMSIRVGLNTSAYDTA
jgi:hypothetical protein